MREGRRKKRKEEKECGAINKTDTLLYCHRHWEVYMKLFFMHCKHNNAAEAND